MSKPIEIDLTNQGDRAPAFGTALSSASPIEPASGLAADALQSTGAANSYRGWEIRQGRWPEPDWLAEHPNYDASWEGEEDGWVDNGLKADAPTYEALCEEIDIIEEECGQ